MAERLQKYIARMGVCSRRKAEELIADGRVTVDGVPATLGISVEPGCNEIKIDGKRIAVEEELVYIMLNKPRGYVTTTQDERGRKTVMELVRDVGTRVYPVGRLDMFSEGLLLLTNDGKLTKYLTHPSHDVEKQYLTRVVGDMQRAKEILKAPMSLDGRALKPFQFRVLNENENGTLLLFTISEGRNRQIRRMCEAAGLRVVRLRRIAEGDLLLGDLPVGKWRFLTDAEITGLKQMLQ
ncbi:MAG: rRNA pseudouridine synthase [Oscillospiraceae bacterium]|nr:rRNA pseudouridine synthase [Oscillospiraceae bacterium]